MEKQTQFSAPSRVLHKGLQTQEKMLKLHSFQKKTKKGLFVACCLSGSTLGTSYKNPNSTKQATKTPGFYSLKTPPSPGYIVRCRPVWAT